MVQRLGHYDHRRHNLLRCLRCAACGLLEVLPWRTDYTISRSGRTPLPLNLSQMSSDTQDSDGLDMFAVCKEMTSLDKHTDKTTKDSGRELGRPLKWGSDQIRTDTGLQLLTAEQQAINRTDWRVQLPNGLCF